MRHFLIVISIFFLSCSALGQSTKKHRKTSSWRDTIFIVVKLNDTISDKKVVAVDVGQKAIIYVKLKPMMLEARENLSNEFVRDNYQKIIAYFDSAAPNGDTIVISEYLNLGHVNYLIAHQLIHGNANVYYKKQKAFVDTISHRLERYGGNADRFFYLPDKRPFFSIHEYSGILDKHDDGSAKGRYDASVKEGEKLRSVRKQ
jgi:hypothetical protein